MAFQQGINTYQDVQFQTANPGKLIIMLYEKLDEELKRARELLLQGDMLGKGNAILKSQDIIMELNNALNLKAGTIALNLQSIYLFMFRELNEINIKKDVQNLEKLIQVVENLKSAWEKIIPAQGKAASSAGVEEPINQSVLLQG